jgi:hypothetical protein
MKKTIRKLVVRRETISALRALDHRDLIRAFGGLFETGDVCPAQPGFEQGGTCPARTVATVACG